MKLLFNELSLLWNAIYKLFIEFSYIECLAYLSQLKLIPPMLIGSLFSIIVVGVPCYFLSRLIITNYRNKIKLFKKKNKV